MQRSKFTRPFAFMLLATGLSTSSLTISVARAEPEFAPKETANGVISQGTYVPTTEGEAKLGLLRAEVSGLAAVKTSKQEDQLVGAVRLKTQHGFESLSPSVGLQIRQDETRRIAGMELGTALKHGSGQVTVSAVPLAMTQDLFDGQVSRWTGVMISSEQNIKDILVLETALESGLDESPTRRRAEFHARAGASRKLGTNGFVGAMVVFDGSRKLFRDVDPSVLNPRAASSDEELSGPKLVFRAGFSF